MIQIQNQRPVSTLGSGIETPKPSLFKRLVSALFGLLKSCNPFPTPRVVDAPSLRQPLEKANSIHFGNLSPKAQQRPSLKKSQSMPDLSTRAKSLDHRQNLLEKLEKNVAALQRINDLALKATNPARSKPVSKSTALRLRSAAIQAQSLCRKNIEACKAQAGSTRHLTTSTEHTQFRKAVAQKSAAFTEQRQAWTLLLKQLSL